MFKKFSLWAVTNIFLFSVIGIVSLTTLVLILRPNTIKGWGEKSGAYNSLGGVVINDLAKHQDKDSDSGDGPDFSNPLVQKAAKTALSASFYQDAVGQFADGTFRWLDGQAPQPDFSINVAAVKTTFADNLGSLLKDRYKALPKCKAGKQPKSFDLYKINCRAADFDIDGTIKAQKQELVGGDGFLSKDVINAKTLGERDGQTFFERHPELPKAYQAFQMVPLVLAGVAFISGILVILLAETKKIGVRKLGWRMLTAGIFGVILAVLSGIGLTVAKDMALNQRDGAAVNGYRDILSKLMDTIRFDAVKTTGIMALAALAIGGLVLFLTKGAKKTDKKATAPESANAPKPEIPVVSSKHRPEKPAAKPEPVKPTAPEVKTTPPVKPTTTKPAAAARPGKLVQ